MEFLIALNFENITCNTKKSRALLVLPIIKLTLHDSLYTRHSAFVRELIRRKNPP